MFLPLRIASTACAVRQLLRGRLGPFFTANLCTSVASPVGGVRFSQPLATAAKAGKDGVARIRGFQMSPVETMGSCTRNICAPRQGYDGLRWGTPNASNGVSLGMNQNRPTKYKSS